MNSGKGEWIWYIIVKRYFDKDLKRLDSDWRL